MKKRIIYFWNNELEDKREVLSQLNYTKNFSLKNKENIIVLPPIIYLDFIKQKYYGKKIFFGLSNYKHISSPIVLKNLKIKYAFFGFNYVLEIKKYIKNKINLIFFIGGFELDKDGLFFDKLEKQLKQLFIFLNKKNDLEIYLVFSNDNLEILSDDLERIFIFIKKIVNDYFKSGSDKINIFYFIKSEQKLLIYKRIDSLDGFFLA